MSHDKDKPEDYYLNLPITEIDEPTNAEINLFWRKVDIQGERQCWLWRASDGSNGYGVHRFHKVLYKAHRFSFFLTEGWMPHPKWQLDHTCENTLCVNPKHLQLVSSSMNLYLAFKRSGTLPTRAKTHCSKGHVMTEDNVRKISSGKRMCIACDQLQVAIKEDFRKNRPAVCKYDHPLVIEGVDYSLNKAGAKVCRQCTKNTNAKRRETKNEWRRQKRINSN